MKYPEKALGLGVRAGIDIKLTLEKLAGLMEMLKNCTVMMHDLLIYYNSLNSTLKMSEFYRIQIVSK